VKTFVHPGQRPEEGVGIREAKKERAQLVADIAAGKYGEKVEPEKIWTLSQLLDEWIEHGETRGRIRTQERSPPSSRTPSSTRPE
jgi:hypothetical protein